jgi:hypothetical protein
MDDIFEDAITKLYDVSSDKKDLSIPTLEKDILCLASLECVKSAMRRICDVKGSAILSLFQMADILAKKL